MFAQNAPIFQPDSALALAAALLAVYPTPPVVAECVGDDHPHSAEISEPTPALEGDEPTREARQQAALLLDAAGRYLLPGDPSAAADYWDARLAQYDAWHDSLPDEEFAEANCYPPRSLCR